MPPAWKETVDCYVNSPKGKDPLMASKYEILQLAIFQLENITAPHICVKH